MVGGGGGQEGEGAVGVEKGEVDGGHSSGDGLFPVGVVLVLAVVL